jgi:hypothetical protein
VKTSGERMNRLQNEGGEGYDYMDSARLSALVDELTEAEWTRDTTIARRAEWNAAVKALGRAPMPTDIAPIQKRLGYRMDDLRAAVKRHQL